MVGLFTIANVRNEIGDHQAALAAANQAVEIFQDAYGAESPLVANPLGIRGEAFSLLGRYAEAEHDLRRAIELSTAWVGPDHPWHGPAGSPVEIDAWLAETSR